MFRHLNVWQQFQSEWALSGTWKYAMAVASGLAGPVLAGPVFTVILELRMRR